MGGFEGLMHGFSVALDPHNLMWCFVGVTVGNLVGVLPGMGVLSAVSILLPLTFGMKPVAAILMLAGIFYGAQYGGAICSILLNLPCHPPHAVTCLDGFPMTKQGKGGVALGITMMGALFGAAFGILQMIFFAPYIARIAFQFGAAEICSLMLLGLLAGSTLAKGSPLKGVAMTIFGLLLGLVGTDINTGVERFTFGVIDLADGVETRRAVARSFRHRGVPAQRQQHGADQHGLHEPRHARHAAQQGRHEASGHADPARHAGRQPLLADPRHRPDDRLLRRLCGRKRKSRRRRSASATARSTASPRPRPRPIRPCRAISSRR